MARRCWGLLLHQSQWLYNAWCPEHEIGRKGKLMDAKDTRPCPECGGEIKAAAKFCKHCRMAVVPIEDYQNTQQNETLTDNDVDNESPKSEASESLEEFPKHEIHCAPCESATSRSRKPVPNSPQSRLVSFFTYGITLRLDEIHRTTRIKQLEQELEKTKKEAEKYLILLSTTARKLHYLPENTTNLWIEVEKIEDKNQQLAKASNARAQKENQDRTEFDKEHGALRSRIQDAQIAKQALIAQIDGLQKEKDETGDTVESIQLEADIAAKLKELRVEHDKALKDELEAKEKLKKLKASRQQQLGELSKLSREGETSLKEIENRLRALHVRLGHILLIDPGIPDDLKNYVRERKLMLASSAEIECTIAGYREDIRGYLTQPASLISLLITLPLIVISFAMAIWGVGDSAKPYEISWAAISGVCAVLIVPPTQWNYGLARLGIWISVTAILGIGLPNPSMRWPIVALLCIGILFLFRRLLKKLEVRFLAMSLTVLCLFLGGGHLEYVDYLNKEHAAQRLRENREAQARRLKDMANNPGPYVKEGKGHIHDGNYGWAENIIDELRQTGNSDSASFLEEYLALRKKVQERTRRVESATNEENARRQALIQRCINICLAPRERCWSKYGRGAASCADIDFSSFACAKKCSMRF